jgi:hypothetical protein
MLPPTFLDKKQPGNDMIPLILTLGLKGLGERKIFDPKVERYGLDQSGF